MAATLIPISDADDPRLDPYRAIRERDLVKRDGQFIAEGRTVLNVLVAQKRFAVENLLILENRLEGTSDLLDKLPSQCPAYVVPRAVIDEVAGFPMHRGLLAIGRRPEEAENAPSRTENWRRVVALSGIANHDNMGSIFRNAAAFGADAVLMDAASCDPLYRKAIRVSVGGVLKVPFHIFASSGAMLSWLDGAGFETFALSPRGAVQLSQWHPPQRTALLLGTEGEGLPETVLQARQSLSIEMGGGFDSLNVATASGIALHRLLTASPEN